MLRGILPSWSDVDRETDICCGSDQGLLRGPSRRWLRIGQCQPRSSILPSDQPARTARYSPSWRTLTSGGALQLTSTCCRYLACAARDATQDAVMRCALPEMRMYGAERSWPQIPEMLDARLLLCLSVPPDAAVGSRFGSRLPSGTGYTMALHRPKRPPTP